MVKWVSTGMWRKLGIGGVHEFMFEGGVVTVGMVGFCIFVFLENGRREGRRKVSTPLISISQLHKTLKLIHSRRYSHFAKGVWCPKMGNF